MERTVFKLNADLEESHWWFTARREIINGLVLSIMRPSQGHRVIDIGCGTGANIASLAPFYSVTGLDISEDAMAFARERFPDVSFLCCDAADYIASIAPGNAVILMNDVLEHVELADRFFLRVLEVAPKGTNFLITVPANPKLWSPHDVSHGHYRRYTPDAFRHLWSGLPVDELLFSYFNARLYPIVRGLRLLTRILGNSYGSADTDLSLPPKSVNNLLHLIFAGELAKLKATFRDPSKSYRRGVSLIAILVKR